MAGIRQPITRTPPAAVDGNRHRKRTGPGGNAQITELLGSRAVRDACSGRRRALEVCASGRC